MQLNKFILVLHISITPVQAVFPAQPISRQPLDLTKLLQYYPTWIKAGETCNATTTEIGRAVEHGLEPFTALRIKRPEN
jgi:hypothetical protein